jgi:hypothetical protein
MNLLGICPKRRTADTSDRCIALPPGRRIGTPHRATSHVVVRKMHFGQIFLSNALNMSNYTHNIRYSQSIRWAPLMGQALPTALHRQRVAG